MVKISSSTIACHFFHYSPFLVDRGQFIIRMVLTYCQGVVVRIALAKTILQLLLGRKAPTYASLLHFRSSCALIIHGSCLPGGQTGSDITDECSGPKRYLQDCRFRNRTGREPRCRGAQRYPGHAPRCYCSTTLRRTPTLRLLPPS